jgi:deoxyhypusine synthase
MVTKRQLKIAHDYDFRRTIALKKFVPVKGYNFSKPFNFTQFIASLKTTGFQATNLGIAIDLIKKMRRENLKIILTFTSNLITSGIRDIIAWLVKNRHVHALCTTGGGIEEDIMKCFKPFILGHFNADAKQLYIKGMNRTGNIYAPDSAYIKFEKFLLPILKKFYQRQINEGKIVSSIELVAQLGKKIKNRSSILYWAYRNKIPILCPALLDGSIGDIVWFFKHEHPDFKIDTADEIFEMNNLPFEAKETGVIALGAGTPRHFVLNAQIFKGGAKYAVYISTSSLTEWDGSTSSSRPNEAYTWGKIKLFKPYEKNSVEVVGDATIIFPIVVAGAFLK